MAPSDSRINWNQVLAMRQACGVPARGLLLLTQSLFSKCIQYSAGTQQLMYAPVWGQRDVCLTRLTQDWTVRAHTRTCWTHARACTNALSDQTGLTSSGFCRGLWWDQARDAAVVTSWVGREKGEGATARDVCVCVCKCVHEVTGVYVAT